MEIQSGIEGNNPDTTMNCIINDSGDVVLGLVGVAKEKNQ